MNKNKISRASLIVAYSDALNAFESACVAVKNAENDKEDARKALKIASDSLVTPHAEEQQ